MNRKIINRRGAKDADILKMNPNSRYQRIYDAVKQIPPGKVLTYGQVAELAELYGKARLVGYALFQVDMTSDIPWHRVVNAKGEISYSIARCGGDYLQKTLLEQEGVEFQNDTRIDLKKYRWLATYTDLERV